MYGYEITYAQFKIINIEIEKGLGERTIITFIDLDNKVNYAMKISVGNWSVNNKKIVRGEMEDEYYKQLKIVSERDNLGLQIGDVI